MHANSQLMLTPVGSNTYYYITDALGNVCQIWQYGNSNSASFSAQTYKPFGTPVIPSGTEKFKYAGEMLVGAAGSSPGLYYIGARWMDPELGRWLSLDPELGKLSMPQSMNRYVYCVNNPLRFTDPTGEWSWWDKNWKTVAIVVAVVVVSAVTLGAGAPLMTTVGFALLAGTVTGAGVNTVAYAADASHRGEQITAEGLFSAAVEGGVQGFATGAAVLLLSSGHPGLAALAGGLGYEGGYFLGRTIERVWPEGKSGEIRATDVAVQGFLGAASPFFGKYFAKALGVEGAASETILGRGITGIGDALWSAFEGYMSSEPWRSWQLSDGTRPTQIPQFTRDT